MPLTTTAFTACDSVVRLDNSSNSLIDISGSSNSVEFDFSNDIGEFKTFGSKWKGRLQCGKDAKIKVKIVMTKDIAEAARNVLDWFFTTGGLKTFQVDCPDSSAGSDRYQCETVLDSFNIPMPADDAKPVMAEINLLPSGAVTWTQL